jgi:heme/copper-type cytochrome/quinol oxidase subunit 4
VKRRIAMKTIAQVGSAIALGMTVIPALLVMSGALTLEANRVWMTVGAVLWFVATPFWMKKNE